MTLDNAQLSVASVIVTGSRFIKTHPWVSLAIGAASVAVVTRSRRLTRIMPSLSLVSIAARQIDELTRHD